MFILSKVCGVLPTGQCRVPKLGLIQFSSTAHRNLVSHVPAIMWPKLIPEAGRFPYPSSNKFSMKWSQIQNWHLSSYSNRSCRTPKTHFTCSGGIASTILRWPVVKYEPTSGKRLVASCPATPSHLVTAHKLATFYPSISGQKKHLSITWELWRSLHHCRGDAIHSDVLWSGSSRSFKWNMMDLDGILDLTPNPGWQSPLGSLHF